MDESVTCTRIIRFCAGHRIVGHESKCAGLHGHTYEAHVTAEAELDELGRVIDFSVLKERIGGWVDENWDHALVLDAADPDADELRAYGRVAAINGPPTAENMAAHLGEACRALFGAQTKRGGTHIKPVEPRVRVTKIVLWETANCYATWRAGAVDAVEDPIQYDGSPLSAHEAR
jgi:6-pyruvoyltetrahydropterin/6-carboxytetrahydropterin synthase